ncbi:PadR family transcriptional regulator [Companilactobacillus paralimentarius]|jgi:Predicted transcriptional regulators|nr:PadR family transcriptional regulator [Companilactobacillus paralimentarius]KAE9563929.1 hypothetical protein ATN96_09680 [Companilactobacillus paralimentarius]MDR4933109.1 PadR family transcriptional regulator [Companilactobacillus paralimentarius]QFR69634.1 hypothetical protein LP238_07415 [Companilactobacillus paralimentarius]
MARSNTLQYMILGLLTRQPMTGYDIKQIFDKEKAEFWTAPFSQIYPELNRLLNKELISLIQPTEDNSRRKVYQLTKLGTDTFTDWLKLPLSPEITQLNNDDFILRLHFLGKDHIDILKALLNMREQTLKLELAQLELELSEVVHHPEQFGRELIIQKELSNKKSDLKLWRSELKNL